MNNTLDIYAETARCRAPHRISKTYDPIKRLTRTELHLGLRRYICPTHGGVAVTVPGASVLCACGRQARAKAPRSAAGLPNPALSGPLS